MEMFKLHIFEKLHGSRMVKLQIKKLDAVLMHDIHVFTPYIQIKKKKLCKLIFQKTEVHGTEKWSLGSFSINDGNGNGNGNGNDNDNAIN